MKGSALSLALIMIAGSLAGCLATDSDGVPEISLTDEDITGLFDDYFMDFVNNSSVTVVNEIHYHNNTTNVDSSILNEGDSQSSSTVSLVGSGESGLLYVLEVAYDFDSLVDSDKPDYRNRTFTVSHEYYDAALDQLVTSDFTVSCGDYYLVGAATGNPTTWWENEYIYWEAWEQAGYNNTYRQILSDYGYAKADYCDEDRWLGMQNGGFVNPFFELHTIQIPHGYAVNCAFDETGEVPQQLVMTRVENSDTWTSMHASGRIQMGESATGLYHSCDFLFGNGTEMEYTIWVRMFNQYDDYRLLFYYQLVPVIGADSDVAYGEWINEVGNTSEPWSLSLEDNQWIEVKSATSLGYKDGEYYNYVSYILSESGYMLRDGFSPIYGGSYSFCGPEELQSDGCRDVDNDAEVPYDEWSIIYRIHSV